MLFHCRMAPTHYGIPMIYACRRGSIWIYIYDESLDGFCQSNMLTHVTPFEFLWFLSAAEPSSKRSPLESLRTLGINRRVSIANVCDYPDIMLEIPAIKRYKSDHWANGRGTAKCETSSCWVRAPANQSHYTRTLMACHLRHYGAPSPCSRFKKLIPRE